VIAAKLPPRKGRGRILQRNNVTGREGGKKNVSVANSEKGEKRGYQLSVSREKEEDERDI